MSNYGHAVSITPSTAALSEPTRAIYVGGAGGIKVTTVGGETLNIAGCLAGNIYPIQATHVLSTTLATSATNLVGLY